MNAPIMNAYWGKPVPPEHVPALVAEAVAIYAELEKRWPDVYRYVPVELYEVRTDGLGWELRVVFHLEGHIGVNGRVPGFHRGADGEPLIFGHNTMLHDADNIIFEAVKHLNQWISS